MSTMVIGDECTQRQIMATLAAGLREEIRAGLVDLVAQSHGLEDLPVGLLAALRDACRDIRNATRDSSGSLRELDQIARDIRGIRVVLALAGEDDLEM